MPFYEEYVTAELAAQLDFNPLSFAYHKPAYNNQETVTLKKIPSSTPKNTKILR
jgi:hypothetical protein